MWIHEYLFKFHYICLSLAGLCVYPWMYSYTHICNVLHVSRASQSFPAILPNWHTELLTRSIFEVTFWVSHTNFPPLMIHVCIKDSSVLIQLHSMKFQFQYLFCQLVCKCLIHLFLGKSLVNPVCVLIFHSTYLFTYYFSVQIWDHRNWPISLSNSYKRYSLNKNCYG